MKAFAIRAQSGLSIVELLVSLVIGMAVIAGSVQLVASSKRNFIDQDEVAFIQNNSRFALDLLAKDVRMAGYLGCATQQSVQTANSIDDDVNGFLSLHGLQGFEGETNTDSFPSVFKDEALAGTDAIIVRRAANGNEISISSHNPASATIHLFENHEYQKGSILMIADSSCRNVGIFQVSGPNGLPANHINHNTGSGTNNCTKIIKGDFVCQASCGPVSCAGFGTATGEYGPGSKVMEFVSYAYYIGDSDALPGTPALKRVVLNVNGAPSFTSEELALGVEDLELLYGVDSNDDGDIDQLRKANDMDLDGDGTTTDDEWDQVLTVKMQLVFRSQNAVLPEAQQRNLAGKEYSDRFMRQLVNSTVRVRNRG